MATPYEYAKETVGKVKQAVYPDPEISRGQAELSTQSADEDFRTRNYYPRKPLAKPQPIRLSGKRSSGKVDLGGKR